MERLLDHLETIRKIRILRMKIRIKQKDMAGMVGVSANTLSRWENRKNVPHKVFIKKMEDILRFRPKRRELNNGKEKDKIKR